MEITTPTTRHPRSHPYAISPTCSAAAHTTRQEQLLSTLETVPDPRDRRGVRYPLAGVLALAATATIAGCRSFAAIGQWTAATTVDHLATFGLAGHRHPTSRHCANSSPDSTPIPSTPHSGCGCGPAPSSPVRGG
ncbi:transposase family protein [Rhodococcus aetherivorans]|uniref:transposase family protein n=1 Tax=Rhodococcus aetherivorans TaxID=191292 RepID=UPI00369DAC6C